MSQNNAFSFMIATNDNAKLNDIKELVSGQSDITRIYGIILYSDRNPYVKKVLRDVDFWTALDEISGIRWPIFAVRPQNPESTSTQHRRARMMNIGSSPQSNTLLLKDFGIEDAKVLPLFVAFIWDNEGVLRQVHVPIEGNDVDSVYHSLETTVKTIAEAEDNILNENKGTIYVYREVKSSLEAQKTIASLRKTLSAVKQLKELISLFG